MASSRKEKENRTCGLNGFPGLINIGAGIERIGWIYTDDQEDYQMFPK
jgi:hypothetical protein